MDFCVAIPACGDMAPHSEGLCRQLLRLPPFPLSRLEAAFVSLPGDGTGAAEIRPCSVFLKDVHLSMVRVLEGSDVALLEPPTLAGYGSAAELYPKNVFRSVSGIHHFQTCKLTCSQKRFWQSGWLFCHADSK